LGHGLPVAIDGSERLQRVGYGLSTRDIRGLSASLKTPRFSV
jgi:hypothetical protein